MDVHHASNQKEPKRFKCWSNPRSWKNPERLRKSTYLNPEESEYLPWKQKKILPRFYFLSNEDLIEILGDSQKPEKIQKHLKKCFEGINEIGFKVSVGLPTFEDVGEQGELEYGGLTQEIISIVSKEHEKVDLAHSIIPSSYDGKVEEWLLELEGQMKIAIRKIITKGLEEYPQKAS